MTDQVTIPRTEYDAMLAEIRRLSADPQAA